MKFPGISAKSPQNEAFIGLNKLYLFFSRCVASLDREKKSEYSLSITAVDGGNPRMTSRVDVTVLILDVNDNTPLFSQKFYR